MSLNVPLTLRNISKRFGSRHVIRDVSLEFGAGEIALLIGANGSGKTTLLKLCAGLLRADSGECALNTSKLGYFGHELLLYSRLTVRENIELFSALHQDSTPANERIESWRLGEHAEERVENLSRGGKARAALARTFIGDPAILLLDEPTSNLDAASFELVVKHLEQSRSSHSRDGAICITSHDVERMVPLVSRVIHIENGEIISDSRGGQSPAAIVEEYRKRNR